MRYNGRNMTEQERQILRAMSPEEKLRALGKLCESLRQATAAGMRQLHPDWTEEQIERAVRKAVLYART
jgi:hypothetical protein